MAFNVIWSDESLLSYEKIIEFLTLKWTENETVDFILKTESLINVIAIQPYLFPASNFNQIRKAVITKQTSVYYLIQEEEIFLITFWDNR